MDTVAISNTLEKGVEIVFVSTPGIPVHRVALVVGTDMGVYPEYQLEVVEQFDRRHVTLRLNRNGYMVAEIPVSSFYGPVAFRGSVNHFGLRRVHAELCWEHHHEIPGLPEESIYCICFMDIFLNRTLTLLSTTPIPYIPNRGQPLLEELNYFSVTLAFRFRRVEFLINLGRKIKNQAHRCVVGDWGEIPSCFYHHIRTASRTMTAPLTHEQLVETFTYFREILIGLISTRECFNEPLCWKLKAMLTDNMDRFERDQF